MPLTASSVLPPLKLLYEMSLIVLSARARSSRVKGGTLLADKALPVSSFLIQDVATADMDGVDCCGIC